MATAAFLLWVQSGALAESLKPDDIPTITEGVIALCRGGTLSGSNELYTLDFSAEGHTIIFEKLVQAGAEAEVRLKDEEWEGIKSLAGSDRFHGCVEYALPIFLSALGVIGDHKALTLREDSGEGDNVIYFRSGFEPKFANAYLLARLIGFEVVDDKLSVVVGVTNIHKNPIRIQLDKGSETSAIGMRGGVCLDKYKFITVRGMGARVRCCSDMTRVDPGDELVFNVSNIPCERSILKQNVFFSLPYRLRDEKNEDEEDQAAIVFDYAEEKNN